MQSQAQRLFFLFRTIVLAGVTAFLITSATLPLPAQDSVPPSAVQAARMPQFATKLARGASRVSHPAQPRASYKRRGDVGTKHTWVPQGFGLYDNGPVNGTTDAWTINFGFVASDTSRLVPGPAP
jgi:hypothetical protein